MNASTSIVPGFILDAVQWGESKISSACGWVKENPDDLYFYLNVGVGVIDTFGQVSQVIKGDQAYMVYFTCGKMIQVCLDKFGKSEFLLDLATHSYSAATNKKSPFWQKISAFTLNSGRLGQNVNMFIYNEGMFTRIGNLADGALHTFNAYRLYTWSAPKDEKKD